MKRLFAISALVGFMLTLSHTTVRAQGGGGSQNASGQRTDAITTAVPFLTISPDPRSGALGDAGAAIADDANAVYWNMSNLAFTENQAGVNFTFTPWLRQIIPDIYHSFLSGYYNFGEAGGVAGLSMRYFSLGNIQFTDEQGLETGNFNANEFALGGHYAHLVTDNFSVGGGLRFIYSNLVGAANIGGVSQDAATSFSGDVSMAYRNEWEIGPQRMPLGFNFGLNISNIGAKMTYNNQTTERDFIPTNLRLGYALKFGLDDYNSITFINDINKLMVPSEGGQSDAGLLSGMFSSYADADGGFSEEMRELMISLGLEYWYNDLFAVRAGYFWEDPNKGDRQFITLGAGLKFKVFSLDFAYLVSPDNTHPLPNTLRFGLGLAFDS
ncbi:MAG: type IX secretion system outer membrane channel protein PorV [Bacteroidota bacterium]